MVNIKSLNLEEFADENGIDVDDYAVNFPIEDGDDPRTVRGTGSTFDEALSEAKEKAVTRRVELGLVDDM